MNILRKTLQPKGGEFMSMNSERHQEDMTMVFCSRLAEKIKNHSKNSELISVLKELGRQLLDELPNTPVWHNKYATLFRK